MCDINPKSEAINLTSLMLIVANRTDKKNYPMNHTDYRISYLALVF
jgi:hypothetical protein